MATNTCQPFLLFANSALAGHPQNFATPWNHGTLCAVWDRRSRQRMLFVMEGLGILSGPLLQLSPIARWIPGKEIFT
jgi:hypothetical protein